MIFRENFKKSNPESLAGKGFRVLNVRYGITFAKHLGYKNARLILCRPEKRLVLNASRFFIT